MTPPLTILLALLPLSPLFAAAAKPTPAPRPNGAPVVRVNSTNQFYDYARPWAKKPPFPRRGTGAILSGNRVLVTAEMVANHTFVELEKPLGGERTPAEVVAVDYDANLALLKPHDAAFLDGMGAFGLAPSAAVGESAEILQVENNGEIARTGARLTTVTVAPYPLETAALLVFRLSAPLQSRDSSFVLPAVRGDELLGLLMRYDARSQTAEVVPFPVISDFLRRAKDQAGLPRAGLSFEPMRDPRLREYVGLEEPGGIYITQVLPGSPADRAGLRRGDILLAIAGHPLDADGLYDDPEFGKILFTHLVSSRPPDAPPMRLTIFRDREKKDIELTPEPPDPTHVISAPYEFDRAPRYVVLGGVVFQELSAAYLREWGNNWRKAAPQRLVYLDAFQNELPADRGKIVIVSAVLPSDDTIGYENIGSVVVTRVNGRDIRSLDDLAEAAKHPIDGFHKIEFEEDPRAIYLDAESIRANEEALARHFGIPAPANLEK